MREDWKTKLRSEDPRERAEAIKAIALSEDRNNLPYLKEIVENDPDPRLRDYARKAARHLFSSTKVRAPEEAAPRAAALPLQDEKPSPPESRPASPEKTITQAQRSAAESKIQRAFTLHLKDQTLKALKVFVEALDLNPNVAKETFTRSVAAELTGLHPDQALAMLRDPEKRKELLNLTKSKKARKSPHKDSPEASPGLEKPRKHTAGPVQAWLSFFGMTEDFLAEEAEYANNEDTLLSVLVFTIAAVVTFMITGFFQFQRVIPMLNQQMAQMGEEALPINLNFGQIFFVMLIGTLIISPLSFFMGAGLQYLGARLFGGTGDFQSHIYLLALIQVPITILGGVVSLLSNVPAVGFIAGLGGVVLSVYSLIVTVRAIKAVHDLSTGRAVAGMIIPPIVLFVLGGCLMMLFGSALLNVLGNLA